MILSHAHTSLVLRYNIPAIVGGVIGGFVVLCLLIAGITIIIIVAKKKRGTL